MKASKVFIKPFDTPQSSAKMKIKLVFSVRPRLGFEELKIFYLALI